VWPAAEAEHLREQPQVTAPLRDGMGMLPGAPLREILRHVRRNGASLGRAWPRTLKRLTCRIPPVDQFFVFGAGAKALSRERKGLTETIRIGIPE
jgi:hypothetical protein